MLVFTICPLGFFFHFAFNDDKLVYPPRKRMRILTLAGKLSACSGDCEYSASSCNAVPSGWPLCTQADSVECCSPGNGAADPAVPWSDGKGVLPVSRDRRVLLLNTLILILYSYIPHPIPLPQCPLQALRLNFEL